MERNTLQERIEIIEIHYKNGENLAETFRKTRTFLGRREAPCRTALKKVVEKFELLGQVSDVKNKIRARRSGTAENNFAVAESVEATVTVNGLRYPEMNNDFLWPKWDSINLDNVYFQQDGVIRATQATKPLIFCGKSFRTVLSLEEVITIGHRDYVI